MAKERKVLQSWEGVKFQSFPLKKAKTTKGSDIYVFGGRYFSLTTSSWAGVEYQGRHRIHCPVDADLTEGIWALKKMQETVSIVIAAIAAGFEKEVTREYFVVFPSTLQDPQFYVDFIGGHYKSTLAGCGRDRNYQEYIENDDVEVIANTSNTCRSGRYGSYASIIISRTPLEKESEGVS